MLEKSEMERATAKMREREREIERERERESSQIMVVFSKCANFKTPIGVNKGELTL